MSYADQERSGRRVAAIAIVALLHAALAYAFITGLAFNVIKKAAQDLKTFDVQDEPPPPPEAPPPPPQVPKNLPPPPIVAPPPIVQVQTPAPTIVTVPTPPPAPVIHEAAPPAPPPKPSAAVPLKPRGDPGSWLSSDDYPASAQRDNAEGVTGFKLEVDGSGKVTNCTVTSSSGNADLDAQTCKLLPRRARFSPAKDAAGNGMASTYVGRTRWQVPKD